MRAAWAEAEERRRNPEWATRATCGCEGVLTLVDPHQLNRPHRRCGQPFRRQLAEWPTKSKMGSSVSGADADTSTGVTRLTSWESFVAKYRIANAFSVAS
jgi:hypothetical protein